VSTLITPEDERWHSSYAVIHEPRDGEGLLSFLLLLDELNTLNAGTTFRAIRRNGTGPSKLGRPTHFLSAKGFDLDELGRIAGGIQHRALERLTLLPLQRWLFGRDGVILGHPTRLRLCPNCLPDRGIPLVFHLADVDSCPDHGLQLIDVCACGTPFLPFGMQAAGTCHEFTCGQRYDTLDAPSATAVQIERSRASIAVYSDLIAATDGPAIGKAALRVALGRLICARAPRGTRDQLIARVNAKRFSLATVVAVCVAAGGTASDIIGTRSSSTRFRVPAEGCPNPSCPSNTKGAPADLVRCARERQCRLCGTRFTNERVLFSFDAQPGYSTLRAARNVGRLEAMRARVYEICTQRASSDRTITREGVLREAGVPPSSYPHLSPRAGLVAILDAARDKQRAARGAIPVPVHADPKTQEWLRVDHRARVVGVRRACRERAYTVSRYYRLRGTVLGREPHR
jgi:TniQ protein